MKNDYVITGKELTKFASTKLNIKRRFLESDKSLRYRAIYSQRALLCETHNDIKTHAFVKCLGLKDVHVTEKPGKVTIKLIHHWWYFPYIKKNKEIFFNTMYKAVGISYEVL